MRDSIQELRRAHLRLCETREASLRRLYEWTELWFDMQGPLDKPRLDALCVVCATRPASLVEIPGRLSIVQETRDLITLEQKKVTSETRYLDALARPQGCLAPVGTFFLVLVGERGRSRRRIQKATARIEELNQQNEETRHWLTGIRTDLAERIKEGFASQIEENAKKVLPILSASATVSTAGWDAAEWRFWEPKSDLAQSTLRLGEEREIRSRSGATAFAVPLLVPFIGAQKTLILRCGDSTLAAGIGAIHSVIIRTALLLPHQVSYTLLDPFGHGSAFPMRRYLPSVRESNGDESHDLDSIIQDIRRINETYLDAETTSFEDIPLEVRGNEHFEIVVAANFPRGYDRRDVERLQTISNAGPRAGKYLVIHHNADHPMPRDTHVEGFESSVVINLTDHKASSPVLAWSSCLEWSLDCAPTAAQQKDLLETLNRAKPPEKIVDWDSVVGIRENDWWTQSAQSTIETPIAATGVNGSLNVWFGVKDGRPCAHGILGAMTGSGKSNLYHALIAGLCIRYSPEELRLYLIDGKDGVEFQPYRNLPHAEVVSLRSSPELSRSVLAELIQEKGRRNALFVRAGVQDLSSYRAKRQPYGKLARVLLLVDEYQELFDGDRNDEASAALLQLAQQGRSAGIHMLLSSQQFGAVNMLHQSSIFGNIHLRMAMQMSQSQIADLTLFGPRGRRIIMDCDRPGKIVLNDRSGDDADEANRIGKAAFLSVSRRDQIIRLLCRHFFRRIAPEDRTATVIFDGHEQPSMFSNPHLVRLLAKPRPQTDVEWAEHARKTVAEGGLETPDWFAAERPLIFWLGQEFNVRGQAAVILRRRPSENVIILGAAQTASFGMLTAALAALSMNCRPERLEFTLLDFSIAGTQWKEALRSVPALILNPAGFTVQTACDSTDLTDALSGLTDELDRRQKLGEAQVVRLPSRVVLMTDLDRVEQMRCQKDDYAPVLSSAGERLTRLLEEGPSLGIHLIVAFSGFKAMNNVLGGRKGIDLFRHRIALQMSEAESLEFTGSTGASRLQTDGPTPVCAFMVDVESEREVRFKPYSTEGEMRQQVAQIGSTVRQWRK